LCREGEVLSSKLESHSETQEIAKDRKLFNQILVAKDTLEQDLRSGKPHSLDDAFAED
jgi:hypothetical protein